MDLPFVVTSTRCVCTGDSIFGSREESAREEVEAKRESRAPGGGECDECVVAGGVGVSRTY